MPKKLWQTHEDDIQKSLGLRTTIASGSQWHDIGDGVTPLDHPIATIIDCKCTEKKSYSVNAKFMNEWEEKAAEKGQVFLLPIRFVDGPGIQDFVVLSMENFLMFWEASKLALQDTTKGN